MTLLCDFVWFQAKRKGKGIGQSRRKLGFCVRGKSEVEPRFLYLTRLIAGASAALRGFGCSNARSASGTIPEIDRGRCCRAAGPRLGGLRLLLVANPDSSKNPWPGEVSSIVLHLSVPKSSPYDAESKPDVTTHV